MNSMMRTCINLYQIKMQSPQTTEVFPVLLGFVTVFLSGIVPPSA